MIIYTYIIMGRTSQQTTQYRQKGRKNYVDRAYQSSKKVLSTLDEGVSTVKPIYHAVSPYLVAGNVMSGDTKNKIDTGLKTYDNIRSAVITGHNVLKAVSNSDSSSKKRVKNR